MEQPRSQTALFEFINSYPYHSDSDFKDGLAHILGHPDVPATEEEVSRDDDLVLHAKCYYIVRKNKIDSPPDPAMYKGWLESRRNASNSTSTSGNTLTHDKSKQEVESQQSQQGNSPVSESKSDAKAAEPAYPSSFAQIVELISTGKPIPGIQHVPDTVLTDHATASKVNIRPKPWENNMQCKEE